MSIPLKNISFLIIVVLLAVSIWGFTAYDTLMVSQRTPNDTRASDPGDVSVFDLDDVEWIDADEEATGLTPPASQAPAVPTVEERSPGTALSPKALSDLGITEPLLEEQVFYATATPNDTSYPQWYSTLIDAPAAWETSTGDPSTVVAVIDTGYALDHEDLSSAWFINTGEQGTTASGDPCWTGAPQDKQTNGCDDDSNSFVDDWRGWDFANNDNSPQAGENYAPGATHGTKSAGLVGARGDNNTGVAAVNWQTQILPLQALYDQGYGYSTDITGAIYYAVEMGADVINLSLGGPSPDSFTRAAVQYALQNNVIVVASSGNCGINQTDAECVGYPSPGGMGYPGRYPETISVGATTSTDTRASFSSYGTELDIVAPGSGSIRTPTWSTSNGSSLYSTSSFGTSFSAPIVAGAIAVLRAEYPQLTKDEVVALVANGSAKVPGMSGQNRTDEYGYGRLNLANLLDELAEYQRQLLKTGTRIQPQNTQQKPQISSNTGHSSASPITASSTVRTYCVTTPGTLCQLTLLKQNASAQRSFTAQRTNNQGVAVFEWSKSNMSNGIWNARVTANSQNSQNERLIIQ